MPRPKRLSEDAEAVTIYLTPEQQLVLQVIKGRRKKRLEPRTSPSEIVADALWHILEQEEKVPRKQVHELLGVAPPARPSKVKPFPQRDK